MKNICARAFEMRMPLRLLLHHLGQHSSLQFSDLQPVLVAPRAWLCSPRGRAVGDHVTMLERTSSRRPALLCPDPSPVLVPTYFFQCHHLLPCLSCSPVISTCHSVVFPKDTVSSTLHVCVLLSDLEFLAPLSSSPGPMVPPLPVFHSQHNSWPSAFFSPLCCWSVVSSTEHRPSVVWLLFTLRSSEFPVDSYRARIPGSLHHLTWNLSPR